MLIKILASSETTLAVTLVTIQSQTNELIFVEGGLQYQPVIRRFALGLVMLGEVCPIKSDDGVLVIPDNFLISRTLVANINKARKSVSGIICPLVIMGVDRVNPNFRYFNQIDCRLKQISKRSPIYYEKENQKTQKTQNIYRMENEIVCSVAMEKASTS